MTKVIRAQTKGMITIPIEFRQKLGIETNSLLEAKLIDDGLMLIKMNYPKSNTELYSDEEIKTWLKDDQIDQPTAKKLAKLLKN